METSSPRTKTLADKIFGAARDGMAITIFALLSNRDAQEVEHALSFQTQEDGQKTTPFLIAARNGHEKVIRLFLNHYDVDVEQVGTVKFDGYVIEGATALWCSAGAGHFDVVRTLLEFGADVNHPTYSNSTPLRAACFDGRLDIVKYLLEHSADLHIPNKYNNTCLMIACYKGHKEVVTHLLENAALPDARAQCGSTALHFGAERGHLDIVKKLIEFGSSMLLNDQCMSPLHIAAESSRTDIVEFFITQQSCDKKERIEALELLGASFANDKDSYDIEKAYQFMWLAMMERFADPENILPKKCKPPVKAYDNRIECQTVSELQAIKDDPEALHMEALIARERILGEDNAEIPHPVIFRGAVFADTARFDQCISLWMRAMRLRQRNDRTITKDLLRFAQVFSQMIHVGVQVDYHLVEDVLQHALTELQRDKEKIDRLTGEEKDGHIEILEYNIHSALYLLVILTKLHMTEEEQFRFYKMVYRLNRLNLRLKESGSTPLHMAMDENTIVDDFHVNDVVQFPNAPLVTLLVKCGAQVNAVDCNLNTPLHIIVKYSKPISNFLILHNIIIDLVEGGAHMDMCNKDAKAPIEAATTGVAEIILRTQSRISLKCICAQAVRKHKIQYKGLVPVTLEEFVNLH